MVYAISSVDGFYTSLSSNGYQLRIDYRDPNINVFNMTISSEGKCTTTLYLDKASMYLLRVNLINLGECGSVKYSGGNPEPDEYNEISVLLDEVKLLPSLTYKIETPRETFNLYLNHSFIKSITGVSFDPSTFTISWQDDFKVGQKTRQFLISMKTPSTCLATWLVNVRSGRVGYRGSQICVISNATSKSSLLPSKSYNINVTNESIQSSTNYIIVIQAGNTWGWGPPSNFNIIKSGPPTNVEQLESISKLKLQWSHPTQLNGQIFEYLVILKSVDNGICKIVWIYKCNNCNDKIAGKHNKYQCSNSITDEPDIDFSASQQMVLESNDSRIVAMTRYEIIIQARNTMGWGEKAKHIVNIGSFKSGPSSNVEQLESSSKLKLQWSPPTQPNGQIFEYLVILKSVDIGICKIVWIYKCNNCNDKIATSHNKFPCNNSEPKEHVYNFSNSKSMMLESNDSRIVTMTKYEIIIQARNAWGWGEEANHKIYIGGFGAPGPVNLSCTNINYNGIKCTWSNQDGSNGIIQSYNVICFGVFNKTLQGHVTEIEKISNQIQNGTTYYCQIKAKNQYGYGAIYNTTVDIPKFSDPKLPNFNVDEFQNIMKDASIEPSDKTKQISITLPLGLLNKTSKIITTLSVVVSLSFKIKNDSKLTNSSKLFDKTYSQCKDVNNCTYEINLNLNSRRKRDLSQTNFVNRPYIVGAMEGCETQGHLCNGPLKSGQLYQIGLRIYSSNEFATVGIIEKGTNKANDASIIIIIVVVVVVLLIVIIVVVVIVKRQEIINRFPRLFPLNSTDERPSLSSQAPLRATYELSDGQKNSNGVFFDPQNENNVLMKIIGNNSNFQSNEDNISNNDEINSVDGKINDDEMEENEYDLLSEVKLKGVSMKDFEENLKRLNENDQELLKNEFNNIKFSAQKALEEKTVEFVEYDSRKNRYCNIIPFTHNVIKINTPDKFINASRICFNREHWTKECYCDEIYVAAQGPIGEKIPNKESTIEAFWQMVVEYHIDSIIMLTDLKEKNGNKVVVKCAEYWPCEGDSLRFSFNKINCEIKTVKCIESNIYCERKIEIKFNKMKRTVTQLHMSIWKDHSFPDEENFLIFYDRFCELRDRNLAKRPIIHCSAGVGRTGSFILIDALSRSVGSPNDYVSVFDGLMELRLCRPEMVQTLRQYAFIYKILLACFKRQRVIYTNPKPTKSNLHDDDDEADRTYINIV